MGNGGGRLVIRIPIPVPQWKWNRIWELEGRIAVLNSRISNLNWIINSQRSRLGQLYAQATGLYKETEEKRLKIDQLTTERDGLIQQKKDLENQLAQIKLSTDLANTQTKISTAQNASLASDYVKISADTTEKQQELFNAIKIQNNALVDTYSNENQGNRTNDQRIYYQQEQMNFINNINLGLFIIYFILLLVCLYILYYKQSISIYIKLAILVGIVLYPFFIMDLEYLIYFLISFIINKLNLNRIFETSS
jgi:uncharacterized coiled-coil protein SlyX